MEIQKRSVQQLLVERSFMESAFMLLILISVEKNIKSTIWFDFIEFFVFIETMFIEAYYYCMSHAA